MNDMKIFENPEFGEIRTVELDGEPWLVGKDVAEALGYQNPQKAIRDHVDNEDRTANESFTVNGTALTLINESGLYSLVLSSKLPGAKRFRRWVTTEVLPSIRKHGAYMTPETLQEAILNPDIMIRLCQQLKSEQDKNMALRADNSRLAAQNQIMQPKADYFDELVERNTLTNFRETAKQIGVGEKVFISFLLKKKYIYRDKRGRLMPYADKNIGLFEIKESYNEKTHWSGTQTLITPKGRETFRLLSIGME